MANEPQRATQGFVATLSQVKAHPSWVLLEVAWRWFFGIPAAAVVAQQAAKVLAATPWRTTGIADVTVNQLLTDPLTASGTIANFAGLVLPPLLHVAAWLAPLLLLTWAVVSAIGRTILLRRVDTTMRPRLGTLLVLQMLRVLPLAALSAVWFLGMQWLGRATIVHPVAAGGEPSIMLYVGGSIVLTLGLFITASLIGWLFSLAPLVSAMRSLGPVASVREALRIGGLRSGLIEINLVLSIVKIALLVLALVFSACPLPFQTELTDDFLFWWNAAVAVWYFLASDFFHVARIAGYLRLVRATNPATAE